MRILMANNSLLLRGGSERVMFDETSWLRARGHEVALFGPIDPQRRSEIEFAEYMPVMANFRETSPLKQLQIAKNVIYSEDTAALFSKFVQFFQPDIVHGHNIYGGLTTSILDVCEHLRLPSVITLHDYKLICPSYRMLRDGKPCSLCLGGKFYHCTATRCHKNSLAVSAASTVEGYFNQLTGKYLKASRLLVPSNFMHDLMTSGGIPADKLRLLRNGVAPIFDLSNQPREDFILYAGRLSEEKGILTLIKAMSGMKLSLRIAGDGPLRPQIEAELQSPENANMALEGHLSSSEIHLLLQKAMALVVPSEWYENASMIVLEAMSAGIPVIGSNIGGIPEQIEDGVSGLLFSPGDRDGLRKAIETIAASPALANRLGEAAQKRVAELFLLDQHGMYLLDEYEQAIRESVKR